MQCSYMISNNTIFVVYSYEEQPKLGTIIMIDPTIAEYMPLGSIAI